VESVISGERVQLLLTDIAMHPENVSELPLETIPGLLTHLAALQTCLAARLVEVAGKPYGTVGNGDDRLFTVEEAAEKLGVTTDWIYHRTEKLPFVVRLGRMLRFSEAGIEKYIKHRIAR
jgi:excisionase family DNA binding protein